MALDAQAIADKWSRNASQSTEAFKAGVQAVTENPAQKAIARKDAWVQGVQEAAADGSYERGLSKITLQSWKDSMLNKGAARIASGVTAAKPKFQAFMQRFIPHLQAGQAKLQSMPRGDLGTNIARAVAMIQHNAEFKMS